MTSNAAAEAQVEGNGRWSDEGSPSEVGFRSLTSGRSASIEGAPIAIREPSAEMIPRAEVLTMAVGEPTSSFSADEHAQRLQRQLRAQQRQIEEQQEYTRVLAQMIMQQNQLNQDEVEMNDEVLISHQRAPHLEPGGSGTVSAQQESTPQPPNENVTSIAPRSASVPPFADSVLSAITHRTLLPRNEEVQKVVDCLFRKTVTNEEHNESEMRQSNGEIQRAPSGDVENNREDVSSGTSMAAINNSSSTESVESSELFDPTQFHTVIRGVGGIGKTTVAALTVARSDVLSFFYDGIAWIKIGQRKSNSDEISGAASSDEPCRLPYQDYMGHLHSICQQLGIHPPNFDEVITLPGEDESVSELKLLRAMELARQEMSNIVNSLAVLLVLDDLWNLSDIEWFSFDNRPTSSFRLLITTRLSTLSLSHQHIEARDQVVDEDEFVRGTWGTKEAVIDMAALKEEEAVELLLSEASSSASISRQPVWDDEERAWDDEDRSNALTIVKCCKCLPVGVRSAGRILSTSCLNDELSGNAYSVKELASELLREERESSHFDQCGVTTSPLSRRCYGALYEVFGRSFSSEMHGDVISCALKTCFTMFAVVFRRIDCPRPWVPVTAIRMLFDGILLGKERLVLRDPGKSETMQLLEKMEALGLVDSVVRKLIRRKRLEDGSISAGEISIICYRVHHDLMLQFALQVLETDDASKEREIMCRLRQNKTDGREAKPSRPKLIRSVKSIIEAVRPRGQATFHERQLQKLNLIVARKYEESRQKKFDQPWDFIDDGYVFEQLPNHLVNAGEEIASKRAFLLLRDDGFIRGRMVSMGVERGTKAHMIDAEKTLNRLWGSTGKNTDHSFLKDELILTVHALCSYLREALSTEGASFRLEAINPTYQGEEIARAFLTVGTSLQKQALWIEALDVFSEALEIYKAAGLSDDHPDMKRTNYHIQMSSVSSLVLVHLSSTDCIKLKNVNILRRIANGEVGSTDERPDRDEAGVSLELSSHPGLAIVFVNPGFQGGFGFSVMPLCVGPKESASHFCTDGESLWRPSDDACMAVTADFDVGDPIFLTPSHVPKTRLGRFFRYGFNVTEQGSICPNNRPDLALGIGSFPVVLVYRSSPTRFIFSSSRELRERQNKKCGHKPSRTEGVPLELASHPGHALVAQTDLPYNVGAGRFDLLAMGMAGAEAVKVTYDGRVIARSNDGAVFRMLEQGGRYDVGSPLILFRANTTSMTRWEGGPNDFVVNEEGSISPRHAPNLAIGCRCLGRANDLVTPKQRALARNRGVVMSTKPTFNEKVRNMQLGLGVLLQFKPSKIREKKL